MKWQSLYRQLQARQDELCGQLEQERNQHQALETGRDPGALSDTPAGLRLRSGGQGGWFGAQGFPEVRPFCGVGVPFLPVGGSR